MSAREVAPPAAKRKASLPLESLPLRESKHPRVQQSLVNQVLRKFAERYGVELPQEDFQMLCGYLCAILAWGYRLHVRSIDAFILLHQKYHEQYNDFQRMQERSLRWMIPAYHEWFQDQDLVAHGVLLKDVPLIDAKCLREIGAESPCTFRLAVLALEFIQDMRPEEKEL